MSEKQVEELNDGSDILNISDEDLMNMGEAPTTEVYEEEEEEEILEEAVEDSEDEDEDLEEEESIDNSAFDNQKVTEDNTQSQPEEKPSKEESLDKGDDSVDYKAVYEELFKPFKANGKMIQVKSADEVKQLMQMGANYNKKMAGIKDQLPYMKMLERNNLLDENRLSYAIDLLNGDQAAISKLIADNKIEVYDLDAEKGDRYSPSYKGVSQQELALAEVVEDIKDSPNYEKTVEIATTIWDNPSQQFIVENPEVLKIIEEHIGNGIYDTVWAEVERQQTYGQLQGMTSLQAYKYVGDRLNEQGTFSEVNNSGQSNEAKAQERELINKKKQATQKPRGAGGKSTKQNVIDPLSLSDEEFEKLAGAGHLM